MWYEFHALLTRCKMDNHPFCQNIPPDYYLVYIYPHKKKKINASNDLVSLVQFASKHVRVRPILQKVLCLLRGTVFPSIRTHTLHCIACKPCELLDLVLKFLVDWTDLLGDEESKCHKLKFQVCVCVYIANCREGKRMQKPNLFEKQSYLYKATDDGMSFNREPFCLTK